MLLSEAYYYYDVSFLTDKITLLKESTISYIIALIKYDVSVYDAISFTCKD